MSAHTQHTKVIIVFSLSCMRRLLQIFRQIFYIHLFQLTNNNHPTLTDILNNSTAKQSKLRFSELDTFRYLIISYLHQTCIFIISGHCLCQRLKIMILCIFSQCFYHVCSAPKLSMQTKKLEMMLFEVDFRYIRKIHLFFMARVRYIFFLCVSVILQLQRQQKLHLDCSKEY